MFFRVEMAVGQDDGLRPNGPMPRRASSDGSSTIRVISRIRRAPVPRCRGHRKFRILLVENDADSKRVLEKRLQKHFHVSSAATGDEALLLLKSQSIDVVISDMQLADTNGFDLCGMIKNSNRTRHVPVIRRVSNFARTASGPCNAVPTPCSRNRSTCRSCSRLNNLLRTKDVLRDYYMTAGSVGITTPELNNTDERFILSVTDYIMPTSTTEPVGQRAGPFCEYQPHAVVSQHQAADRPDLRISSCRSRCARRPNGSGRPI